MKLLTLCVLICFCGARGAVRKWFSSTRVLDTRNWDSEDAGCRGLKFTHSFEPKVYLGSLSISKVVLPHNGKITLGEGTKVVLDSANKLCINLKEFKFHSVLDERYWDGIDNEAVVDVERIPCQYDDVVFPEINTFSVRIEDMLRVKSLTIGGAKVSNDQWRSMLKLNNINVIREDSSFGVNLMSSSCLDPNKCRCQENPYTLAHICEHVKTHRNDSQDCHNPVHPFGHCTKICGALLTLLPEDDFNLTHFRASLDQFEGVEYHVTRTLPPSDNHKLQLVIVDKDKYAEQSVKIGKLVEKMINENDLRVKLTMAQYSGRPNVSMKELLSVTLGIMFAALFATLAFFGVIYYYYVGSPKDITFRLPRGSNLRPFVFARFENNEDGGLSFERRRQSAIVEAERSFDNPMFGLPSTSQLQVDEQKMEEIEDEKLEDEVPEALIRPTHDLENFEEMVIEDI